jgi:hypothetical protein
LSAIVLEESQPSPPLTNGPLAKTMQKPAPLLLLSLYALAWLLAVAAGLLWLWLGYSLYIDARAGWEPAAAGLTCLLASVYAARVAHTLCSRTEVHSTLTWLELEGRYSCPPADPRQRTPTGDPVLPPVSVHSMTLKACSAQVRSIFYAEAAGMLGGRVVLEVVDDPQLARSWGQLAAAATRGGIETATAARTGPGAPVPRKARPQRAIDPDPPPARRPPRFCSACGTQVLSGERFCQHCGNVLD